MYDEFCDFVRLCYRKTELIGWWGKVVNWLTLILGWALAWIVYSNPNWPGTSQARVGLWLVVIIPVSIATLLVVGRLLISPFLVFRDLKVAHATEVAELRKQLSSELKSQRHAEMIEKMSAFWTQGKRLLDDGRNVNRDIHMLTAEARQWFDAVTLWLKGEWATPSDAHYFVDCDDGWDSIPNYFPSALDERNSLCRNLQQRTRNLRVILDREIAKLR